MKETNTTSIIIKDNTKAALINLYRQVRDCQNQIDCVISAYLDASVDDVTCWKIKDDLSSLYKCNDIEE